MWQPDVLDGYESYTIALPEAELAPGEPDIELCATLVRRKRGRAKPKKRAVLYVHGWNDYFFQTELADRMVAMGIDFYALDLRRYGRSLREGLLPGYTTAISNYFVELDAAVDLILADGVDQVALMGHSTGGLVLSNYAAARQDTGKISALLLNSPWLDLAANPTVRKIMRPIMSAWSRLSPTSEIPMPEDPGFYSYTCHRSLGGIWEYDFRWKSPSSFPILAGWARAIVKAQTAVSEGLELTIPVLCCSSAKSVMIGTWSPELTRADIVLDVEMITARAATLGECVTIVRVPGGMHDLALSDPDAREYYFAAIERWVGAYYPA